MKALLLLILTFFAFVFTSRAQTERSIEKEIESSKEEEVLVQRWKRNQDFYERTLLYSDIGFVSPPLGDWGSRKKYYILSADVIPNIGIGGFRMPFALHITPRFKVRIFRENPAQGDSSLPVRTPSYLPGASIYFRLPVVRFANFFQYCGFSAFHHSNGQDGNEENTIGQVNTYNGNFSTNFLELSYHFSKRRFFKAVVSDSADSPSFLDYYGKIGYERHVLVSDYFTSRYGLNRINLKFGIIRVNNYRVSLNKKPVTNWYKRELGRVIFNVTYIAGVRSRDISFFKNRINIDASVYCRVSGTKFTAIFLTAGYYGSDPYNIYFKESYPFVRTGLALGNFVYSDMKLRREGR